MTPESTLIRSEHMLVKKLAMTRMARLVLMLGLMGTLSASMGGCELSCDSNSASDDVKDVVDEIGDEVEDVADEVND